MKKMIKTLTASFFAVMFVLTSVVPVFAGDPSDPEVQRYVDYVGLLTTDEAAKLEQKLDDISGKQGIDVVVVVMPDVPSDYSDVRVYAADCYEELGYDDDGVEFFIAPADRDWTIVECGYGMTAFTDDARDYMSDILVDDYLHDNDYYGGFMKYADLANQMLIQAHNGHPFTKPFNTLFALLIAVVVGAIVGGIVAGAEKGKLKTVRFKPEAADYVKGGSMVVNQSRDFFLYSHVSRTEKPKDNGKSGSFSSSSGGSFSGSSGKY